MSFATPANKALDLIHKAMTGPMTLMKRAMDEAADGKSVLVVVTGYTERVAVATLAANAGNVSYHDVFAGDMTSAQHSDAHDGLTSWRDKVENAGGRLTIQVYNFSVDPEEARKQHGCGRVYHLKG